VAFFNKNLLKDKHIEIRAIKKLLVSFLLKRKHKFVVFLKIGKFYGDRYLWSLLFNQFL